MKALCSFLLAAVVILVSTASVSARLMKSWSYQELFDNSDLVVIVTPTQVRDTKERIPLPDYTAMRVVGVETTFGIATVLKGDKALKTVILHHYRSEEPDKHYPNTPHLVSFDPAKDGAFMLFLVREADGRYAPVTGQTDPGYFAVHPLRKLQ